MLEDLYEYLQGDFYNSLPSDLKEVIATTRVVSGHGVDDSNNFITNDKLYLFNLKELYNNTYDYYSTASSNTRQLDYYATGSKIKHHPCELNNVLTNYWWLRDAWPGTSNGFSIVYYQGLGTFFNADSVFPFYPAFRIT